MSHKMALDSLISRKQHLFSTRTVRNPNTEKAVTLWQKHQLIGKMSENLSISFSIVKILEHLRSRISNLGLSSTERVRSFWHQLEYLSHKHETLNTIYSMARIITRGTFSLTKVEIVSPDLNAPSTLAVLKI